jgi:hypothetical protein
LQFLRLFRRKQWSETIRTAWLTSILFRVAIIRYKDNTYVASQLLFPKCWFARPLPFHNCLQGRCCEQPKCMINVLV